MKTVVIFGGAGFVGRNIIRRIVQNDYKIIIPYQKQVNEAKLRLLGTVGQVIPLKFKHLKDDKILLLLNQADIIINLKTLWDEKKIKYNKGILDFNKKLVDIIKDTKENPQFIYFSGIGIDKESNSFRSKAIFLSEKYMQTNLKNSIIIKPSVIIGGGDKFLKNLLPLFKVSFFIPLFGNGLSKFQPVFIDDVCMAVKKIIDTKLLGKYIYEFVGIEVFTYKDFFEFLSQCINKKRVFVKIPFKLAKFGISIFEKTPFSPINLEQLKLFESDNISYNNYKKLEDLNILPQDVREIIKKIVKKNM
jgi:NADH dehydrogenase